MEPPAEFFRLIRMMKHDPEYNQAMKENAPYLTLGFQLAATIGIGALIGYWIDGPEGKGLGTGIGAGIGAFLGLAYFLKVVLVMTAREEKNKKLNQK
jgi:hypothetical protein